MLYLHIANSQTYQPYSYDPDFSYESGWDKYALKYATLLKEGSLYNLHKVVMYGYIDRNILPAFNKPKLEILDVNCGTGNDFPYLLTLGNVTGIDGSAGMLNKAAETYSDAVHTGTLKLYDGMLEQMQEDSFGGKKFDIIYSITGGFSYIDDNEFQRVFSVLKTMLKPGGVIVAAHLNTFCLSETLVCLLKGRFMRSIVRLKKTIPNADGSFMYLRSKRKLETLLTPLFDGIVTVPLIVLTPPYQTDMNLSAKTVEKFRKLENQIIAKKRGISIADQIITVCR
ncbi:MAG: class I SAM-dependent methyltransferase [Chitinophagales bacterium]|nr:class I SAM-dependent methyltransferase [Chitinophagaceae bacterium]MCB9064894.1 class I SAM-dependent methyltransferase [Chitinophagales bacterium]